MSQPEKKIARTRKKEFGKEHEGTSNYLSARKLVFENVFLCEPRRHV